MWVNGEGKSKLRAPVWGPVLADVSVTPENAAFVEQAIRTSLLKCVISLYMCVKD